VTLRRPHEIRFTARRVLTWSGSTLGVAAETAAAFAGEHPDDMSLDPPPSPFGRRVGGPCKGSLPGFH
jgi:hypothetical protein